MIDVLRGMLSADLAMEEEGAALTWADLKAETVGAEGSVIEELERRGFPRPIGQHAVVRDAEGVAVAEADPLFPHRLVVWVHGSPHHYEHVERRDAEQGRRLRALGYRVVTIWPERHEEGLRDLAKRLDRPDLLRAAVPLRLVPRDEAQPFDRHLPVSDLEAAAGAFSEGQVPEEIGWFEVLNRKLSEGMFVARVVGESMNRRIPNGAYCLFQYPVTGSRQGRVLLVQHRDITDPDHGGHYTVKIYESEKEPSEEGEWTHRVIRLKPDSTDSRFEPIVVQNVEENKLAVIAEFLQVVGS